ncbi:MAG: membrane dipeptidase [Gemmatimonadota bacterium]
MSLDRREFLKAAAAGTLLPGQLAAAMARQSAVRQEPGAIDRLYSRSIVIDSLAVGLEWDAVEYEAAKKTGYTGIQTTLPSRNLEIAVQALAEWNDRVRTNSGKLVRAVKAADIERAKREGKLAVVLGFQNATMIERSIDNLDVLYDLGTRCIQLTYNDRNLLGNGCTERVDGGLSDFGVAAVRRMNELGIVVDLSHCGRRTTLDGIEFSDPPACFTHTMCEALYRGHPRAKTDEQIRAMADKGGVMGVAALGYFVGPDPGGETTIETYLDQVDHAVRVAGIDHVGLCTDFQLRGISSWATKENWYEPRLKTFKPSYQVRWPPWIPELDSVDRFRNVARGLDRRGYTHEQIEKILGRNWLDYFRGVFGG